jgi:ATP-dependent helicase HrpB
VIESLGRAFPVDTRYLGRDERLRLEDRVVRAVERGLAEETGSLLVFLPGQGEIHRVARLVNDRLRLPNVDVVPLYGGLDRGEPQKEGRPRSCRHRRSGSTTLAAHRVRVRG